MRRLLLLGLSLLLTAGCVSAPIRARYDALQNPVYRGDANKDLVPYRARDRDGMDCVRSENVQAKMATTTSANDPDTWDAFFACMAAKGWR